MDEIAAHLDAERRLALFEEVLALGVQSWMTGTDADLFKPLATGKPGKNQLATNGEVLTLDRLEELEAELGGEFEVSVRSVLKCRAETGGPPCAL